MGVTRFNTECTELLGGRVLKRLSTEYTEKTAGNFRALRVFLRVLCVEFSLFSGNAGGFVGEAI